MIGITLSRGLLIGSGDNTENTLLNEFGGREKFLQTMWDEGVRSVELKPGNDISHEYKTRLAEEIKMLASVGLMVSIHSGLRDDICGAQYFEEHAFIFDLLLKNQKHLPITIHPYTGTDIQKTVKILRNWAEAAAGLPVKICVENTRNQDPAVRFDEIQRLDDIIAAVDSPNVGITWDIGHHFWSRLKYPDVTPEFPSAAFLTNTAHTHIHGLEDGFVTGRTHFPLLQGFMPFEDYSALLKKHGFDGVYNLELMFSRFAEKYSFKDGLLYSIQRVRACL